MMAALACGGCSSGEEAGGASGNAGTGGGAAGASGAAGQAGAAGMGTPDAATDAEPDAEAGCPIDVDPGPGMAITDRGAVKGAQDGSYCSCSVRCTTYPSTHLRRRTRSFRRR